MTEEIKKLTDYSHIRLRVPMYLGSPDPHTQQVVLYDEHLKPYLKEVEWIPAIYTAFREILDNALDEVVGHGHGNRIDIDYDETKHEFTVEDNGRGIPTDWDESHQIHKATLALSEPRAGRNFGERGNVAGTNGIGAAATNITSEWFQIDIGRNGERFQQRCTEGNEVVGEFLQIEKAKIKSYSGPSYTRISFKPSSKVFKKFILPLEFVRSRITEIALVNPTVKIFFNKKQIKVKPRLEQNLFEKKPIIMEIRGEEKEFVSRFYVAYDWHKDSDFTHTVVNNIPAFNGGIHIETFRRMFFGGLLTALEKESKRRKLVPNRSDVADGLFIYNVTTMLGPDFDAQSKTRLVNEEAGKAVKKFFDDPETFRDIIKKNKEWIDAIYLRCSERTMKKDAADIAKAAKKNSRLKIASLMDATGKDRTKCILTLAEGESAINGMTNARNAEIHGGLPLRGKVLNVNGEDLKTVVNNAALTDITTSIGLVVGQKAKRDELRYGKVYIAHDMDEDGKNIGALLINFFYTFWPELFDSKLEPFIHIFQTPFIIADKGKQRKYWYARNYHDFKPEDYSGWTITRAKGLGTLTEDDWVHAINNPELIPVVDDGRMKETLDLIFNNKRSDDRKEWIGI